MNGIRYVSACLGGSSQNIFRNTSRNHWRQSEKSRSVRQNGNYIATATTSRGFHHSVSRCAIAAEDDSAVSTTRKRNVAVGPDLADFILANTKSKDMFDTRTDQIPYLKNIESGGRSVYFEIYGCQMNVNDSDVVWAILKRNGYKRSYDLETADIVLLVTCAIRDGAEEKVWNKLDYLKSIKNKRGSKKHVMKIGILGCMAERLKSKIFERNQAVDVIAGPDSYKDLPRLLALSDQNETAINVILSADETYADITPVRLNEDSKCAFVSIMRGCDNMCTYCIVPFTRGRERSRPITSILREIQHLSDQGYKEVTLLGQNVNSYRDLSESNFFINAKAAEPTAMAKGFKTVYKSKIGGIRFDELLDRVSLVNPEMRIRFTSPHPKDFPDQVLQLIAERPNICQQLHLPAQSGSSAVLERMRRGYTREAYLELVDRVRSIIPRVSLSSDFIAGFCDETEEEFQQTLNLMEQVEYNKAYLFAYSMREKTTAHRRLDDNVAMATKKDRVRRMNNLFKIQAERLNRQLIGSHQLVLIEGNGRRANKSLVGRNDGNIRVVIPDAAIPANSETDKAQPISPGDYVVVQIYEANMNTLSGVPLYHSSISRFTPYCHEDRGQRPRRSSIL